MGATANVQGTGNRVQGSIGPSAGRRPLTARRRPSTARRRPSTAGFTLVEMLVVIVIIGILGSLITGAAIVARNRAKRATARMEISQLEMALTQYKQEFGEFPPDFANLQNTNAGAAAEARAAVVRHLRKRFPRYQPGLIRTGTRSTTTDALFNAFAGDVSANYPTNPAQFNAASALAFWLGGLPEAATSGNRKPAGFHSNPEFPFAAGLPRTQPLFDFDPARLEIIPAPGGPRYAFYANTDTATAPYVYFRSQRLRGAAGQYEYGYLEDTTFYPLSYPANGVAPINNWGRAVPYLDTQTIDCEDNNVNTPGSTRLWRNQDNFQIVFAGFDNVFGDDDPTFRFSRLGQQLPRTAPSTNPDPIPTLNAENFDNITNFTSDTIEAEMQQ